MTQSRLKNSMVTHIHKELTDSINHLQVLHEFHQQMKTKLGILDIIETNLPAIICWVDFANHNHFVRNTGMTQ